MATGRKQETHGGPPRVALIVETSGAYGRGILGGISRYLHCHRRWSVFLEQRELGSRPPGCLLRETWDGIVCRPTDPALASLLRATRTPVVDLNDLHDDLGLPRVCSDHRELGRAAAEHLLERAHRHFAFCGYQDQAWSDQRHDGFRDAVAPAGAVVSRFTSPWRGTRRTRANTDLDRIARWLAELPKPLGLLACNDVRGLDVLNACERAGIRVPEDVAVIGVDNESIHCDFCNPPLSSVEPDAEGIGYRAAEMLDRLMHREKPASELILLPARKVVARPSTDVLAVDDELVRRTFRHIRENALRGCTVDAIAARLRVSRSTLERRCRAAFGRSPQEEIRRVRLEEIRKLLLDTDFTLEHIAELCGFGHAEYLSVFFKRMTRQTPGGYRRRFRHAAPRE